MTRCFRFPADYSPTEMRVKVTQLCPISDESRSATPNDSSGVFCFHSFLISFFFIFSDSGHRGQLVLNRLTNSQNQAIDTTTRRHCGHRQMSRNQTIPDFFLLFIVFDFSGGLVFIHDFSFLFPDFFT